MKTPDVTKSVMQRVTAYERRNTSRWIMAFITVLAVLSGLALLFARLAYGQVSQMQTVELFRLLFEDPSVVSDFWRDTLSVILTELPVNAIVIAGILSAAAGLAVWATGRKRRIIARIRRELANREQKVNNKPHGKETG